ncbi:keratin, type II cytoskeletal 2 epidermal-like [Plutella xylostella]|uniref:keratin, type II cytoskeletal 2 epidermal-like n=1 Tax=Plutella xylostella TaxID=51655 RepID=UPI0020328FFD|nr:keratin, type II cytoskeletal 2 epidermal-like [Plutella xylostella]
MSVGKLAEFQVRGGTWSSYVDRLEMYYKVNKISADLKLPILIASMGDEAYELLVNLACPSKPSDITYEAACDLLRDHLQPSPSVWAERFRFRQRRQSAEENVSGYVAALKKAARLCNFGDKLNDNLRDQLVCGLRSDVIRQRLFAEDDTLTFTNAVKLATSLEAAEINAAAVEAPGASGGGGGGGAASSGGAVHALELAQQGRARGPQRGGGGGAGGGPHSSRGAGSYSSSGAGGAAFNGADGWRQSRGHEAVTAAAPGRGACRACGARNHSENSCRFRDYVCSRCRETGHLRRVCPRAAAAAAPRAGCTTERPSRNLTPGRSTSARAPISRRRYTACV